MTEHSSTPPFADERSRHISPGDNHCNMSSESSLIEAEQIGRRTPGSPYWLFRGVSLRLQAGERLSIVGPSGSGKTLLLRSLALLDPTDEGAILWQGKSLLNEEVPLFRSHVIYLHQRAPLIEGSVEDNLRYPFTFNVRHERELDLSQLEKCLARLERDASFLTKSSRDLSGGEQQLVALLRAVLLQPDVLLLDEPTGAIDSETTHKVEALLEHWLADHPLQRGMILVSHDRQQAARFSDRVMQMESGRLTQEI